MDNMNQTDQSVGTQGATSTYLPFGYQQPCPSCGACPTCGARRQYVQDPYFYTTRIQANTQASTHLTQ